MKSLIIAIVVRLQVPRLRSDAIYSKDVESAGKPLETRLVGAHLPGRGFTGFWVYPFYSQGASGCASLLHRIFNSILRKDGKLPRVLLLHMDNTSKENKNNLMIKYLCFLVFHGVFDEVRILFLLVGHTHSVIDQRFSVISRELSAQDAYTLLQLMQLVAPLKLGGSAEDHDYFEVKQALDFFWLLHKDQTWYLKGFATLCVDDKKHCIHAMKMSKGTEGDVVLEYKEHDRPGPWSGHHETNAPIPVSSNPPPPPH
jgi:hypothetical protein